MATIKETFAEMDERKEALVELLKEAEATAKKNNGESNFVLSMSVRKAS